MIKILTIFLMPLLIASSLNAQSQPLIQDPLVFSGQLGNGMRYAVMPNDGPSNTASIRLYLNVGSLNEKDDERGFAHFVEHMAFNGSNTFPEDTLVEALQNHGIAFGMHANAATDFESTIYSIDIPDIEEETVDLALTAFRETASNLTFNQDAVERERRVVIAEMKTRNSKGLEVYREKLKFWDATNRANERFAIGTRASIETASAQSLRTFYKDFYRPENAFLVFVGDVEVDAIEKKIHDVFGNWQSNGVPRDLSYMQERLPSEARPKNLIISSVDGVGTTVTVTSATPYTSEAHTYQSRKKSIIRYMALNIMARRFDDITREADTPILGTYLDSSPLFDSQRLTTLELDTTDEKLQETIILAEQELRRAIEFGFTESEVSEQKANFRTAYEHAEKSADKRPNSSLADQIVSTVKNDKTLTHPADDLQIYLSLEPRLTAQELHKVFLEMWSGVHQYFVTAGTSVRETEQFLNDALLASQEVAVTAPSDNKVSEFAYNYFGEDGEVVLREIDEDLDYVRVKFSNNLMVNLKPTRWEDNTVRMVLRLGGGIASLPKDLPGIHTLAGIGLINGGLGKHKVTELNSILAGRTNHISMHVTNTSFAFPTAIVPDDMLMQFKLWAAYLTDASYRPEAYGVYDRAIDNYFQSLKSSPNGVLKNAAKAGSYLYQDARFELQSLETLKGYQMDDLETVMKPVARRGALELTIVGDFEIDLALDALKSTLGALSERESKPEFDPALQTLSFLNETQEVILRHEGGIDQGALHLYWPTMNGDDFKVNAQILLLKHVLTVLLNEEFREKTGLAYTPSVTKYSSPIFFDYGYLAISTDIAPDKLSEGKKVLKQIVSSVAEGHFTEEIIERARKPLLESLRNERKNNQDWLTNLQSAQTRPAYSQYFAGLEESISKITHAELHATAKEFLSLPPVLTFEVVHKDTQPSKVADSDTDR